MYNIPGTRPSPQPSPADAGDGIGTSPGATGAVARSADEDILIHELLAELDRELVGLSPVKARVRDIAALLVIDRLRRRQGLQASAPSLHMSFTGNPGTGKTTVARRMAEILHRLGYLRTGHLVSVSRDDLVGQYVGHTAPKTREVLKRAMGGVLFIDEAYYLYRPDNERDYGPEAIEILLQVMENDRDDLVVILAGYRDRMETFFRSNPGMRSRVAHHLEFPDFSADELLQIAERILHAQQYGFGPGGREAFREYLERRTAQPLFANARSVRNALDRARLRQASRLFAENAREFTRDELSAIVPSDIRASRVFEPSPKPSPRPSAALPGEESEPSVQPAIAEPRESV
jgi:probable Rubsico expression protein CbbX